MTTKSKTQEKSKMSEIDENISKLFDIKKRLGKGAYGIVWKALDKRSNETLAVKKIFDAFRDETDAQRTFREIVFLKAFRNHPNVVRLHNVYKATNNLDIYLIFEYMESDLHNIIKKGTILKDVHKRYVMYQLINAIKYIHSGNVIHRDLKPSNVLIDSKCRCKLADFGLARSVSSRPVRDNTDMANEMAMGPLLTDYVATRWYRAPEILVASKRYTKGIDMWSLGCILGEMIRGKPLFQGTSTVNQIEKIVTALPEVTEHDIRAVGAGFGSVLLNKQISREKKTTLDALLSDASRDAVDLVKSLLVLDPLARLTAKQAICHPYVEKFRNSIPELELSVDVLPPFRDDVRLTVPEYRSKLYEIVQVATDKPNGKAATSLPKHRENKNSPGVHERAEQKKGLKAKQNGNVEEKYISKNKLLARLEKQEQEAAQTANLTHILNKALRKSSSSPPVPKRRHSKASKSTASDPNYMENADERTLQRSKGTDGRLETNGRLCINEAKRHSIDCGTACDVNRGTLTSNGIPGKQESAQRLCRSSSSLHKADRATPHARQQSHQLVDKEQREKQERLNRSTPILKHFGSNRTSCLRNTKSEGASASNGDSRNQEQRTCYERRLKKLEEEIERYKKEVRSFCKETIRYSNCAQSEVNSSASSAELLAVDTCVQKHSGNGLRSTSVKALTGGSTPIKNTYFQLLTKGNHDCSKVDFDICASGDVGGDYEHFGRPSSVSLGGKHDAKQQQQHYNYQQPQPQQQQQQQQQQPRLRPLSKFI